jgi:protein arginine N-methyltransferase 1
MHPMTRFFNWGKRNEIAVALAREHIGFRELTAWYPEWIYEIMETDDVRNTPYREAIEEAVAGKVVLELGTGRKALWAICCARAGAKRVYAIEANEKSYRASEAVLRSQGIDNVNLICGFSDKVDLPERCDVLVHDLIGDIVSSEGVVPFVEDAKHRLLKPGALHIPWRCTTYFVLAEDPTLRFSERALSYCLRGFAAYEGSRFVRFFSFPLAAALAEPAIFEDFVFAETPSPQTSRRVAVQIERDGLLRGAHFFIRLHLGTNEIIDTRSGQTSWSTPFLRFDAPTPVQKGDEIRVSIDTDLSANPTYALSIKRTGRGRATEIGRYAWSGD